MERLARHRCARSYLSQLSLHKRPFLTHGRQEVCSTVKSRCVCVLETSSDRPALKTQETMLDLFLLQNTHPHTYPHIANAITHHGMHVKPCAQKLESACRATQKFPQHRDDTFEIVSLESFFNITYNFHLAGSVILKNTYIFYNVSLQRGFPQILYTFTSKCLRNFK